MERTINSKDYFTSIRGIKEYYHSLLLLGQADSRGKHFPSRTILDRGAKFTKDFKDILKDDGIEFREMPPLSSNMNPFAERWVQAVKKECLLIGVLRSLINAIDAKDFYTCGHSDRVALMARQTGEELGLPHDECNALSLDRSPYNASLVSVRLSRGCLLGNPLPLGVEQASLKFSQPMFATESRMHIPSAAENWPPRKRSSTKGLASVNRRVFP